MVPLPFCRANDPPLAAVIGLLVDDLLGDVALATHRVDGHDGALDRQHVEQLGNGDDFVRLVRHLDPRLRGGRLCPSTRRWRAAKAETMWIAAFASFL